MSAVFDGALLAASPTNLLSLIAVALLAGRDEKVMIGGTLFALGVIVGSITIAYVPRELPGGLAQLAVALVAGVLLAAMWKTALIPAGLVWLAGGEALAWNTPPQSITLAGARASQIGAAVAGIALFAIVAWIVSLARQRWQHVALRIAGSWIAASAILVLALRLAR